MPEEKIDIKGWRDLIRKRYESYLRTSFYFKDAHMRRAFKDALEKYDLMKKKPLPEFDSGFKQGESAHEIAREKFGDKAGGLLPALLDKPLYAHQAAALRKVGEKNNVVIATGTASGKTESFLYPILFELYRQHLEGKLQEPGVRALILYPMNALANDQRRRLGEICEALEKEKSSFTPTFGQYIGATPEHEGDAYRQAQQRQDARLPGELVFRNEMRETPPHILLTNYSMLEYLLLRPEDSELFDGGMGKHWQFLVLDEAHQYRGARGMEMGMLVRRLTQRLRDGGREEEFRCIATSATISSGQSKKDQEKVAQFAWALFGQKFHADGILFGGDKNTQTDKPRRYHLFMRALEGAFLAHKDGKDSIVLNRKTTNEQSENVTPLEIALCAECGQHYYVGKIRGGRLDEAIREPSDTNFGVEFYLPEETSSEVTHILCRNCAGIYEQGAAPTCDCSEDARIGVKKCENHEEHLDQLKECAACGYKRGGVGDPVREIVHGFDAPNSVIVTALRELMSERENSEKILAFADSRQEAAFFAWYAEDSYNKIRDRNLIYRALKNTSGSELSAKDLMKRIVKLPEYEKILSGDETTPEGRKTKALEIIYHEALTEEARISLEGVGLVEWWMEIPQDWQPPEEMTAPPWNFSPSEARDLLAILLNNWRARRAIEVTENVDWQKISQWPQETVDNTRWTNPQQAVIHHYLRRILGGAFENDSEKRIAESKKLMYAIWESLRAFPSLLQRHQNNQFRLNLQYLRVEAKIPPYKCDTCARLTFHNVRGVCPRNRCPGNLVKANAGEFEDNHYRILYKNDNLPVLLRAAEHTAQLENEAALKNQQDFMDNKIHLLSSSTTFEVGVDLGDLETVFLRNVPPESFNYVQRAGRAGRREGKPGLAITYCRRNSHDLHHYENPEETLLHGAVRAPVLRWRNEKIVLRHLTAVALSEFFKANRGHFGRMEVFIKDWETPLAAKDFLAFCHNNKDELKETLAKTLPKEGNMHEKCGLIDDTWPEKIAGENSRLKDAEDEICADYLLMRRTEDEARENHQYPSAESARKRKETIAKEQVISFLSRKAIIPKYGFPVDVVGLNTWPRFDTEARKISLQRDLSQAIAEYAPGAKVVANKKEWTSRGIRIIPGRNPETGGYNIDGEKNFYMDGDDAGKKYLIPQFGFVTKMNEKAKTPKRRPQRLYTTRPYFIDSYDASSKKLFGVKMTQASPGEMMVLCQGRNRQGFYICLDCGAGFPKREWRHTKPTGGQCGGTLSRFTLGHRFTTDVVRLHFPNLRDEWHAYSLAYALLLGAAQAMDVPANDLNVTITRGESENLRAVVLYDNVPGGAGLVADLWEEDIFENTLKTAAERMKGKGKCECDESCYGCLRDYRNQFAHPYLRRKDALHFLNAALNSKDK